MNIYQRAVLAIGAIVLMVVINQTPPLYKSHFGQYYHADSEFFAKSSFGEAVRLSDTAALMDVGTASIRAVQVLGATMLICFALKGLKDIGK